jgi:DNA polymerase epsilon subunit 1
MVLQFILLLILGIKHVMSTNTGKYIPENRQNDFSSDSVSANMAKRIEEQLTTTELDQMYGYIDPIKTGEHSFTGYVINMHPGTYLDVDTKKLMSCLDLYVVKEDGTRYKIALPFMHYFYIMPTSSEVANDLAGHLTKKFKLIAKVEKVKKEDLSLNNHLVGLKRTFLKVFFNNIDDLSETRREIQRIANKNKFQIQENTTFKQLMETHNQEGMSQNRGHKKPNDNNNSKNKSTTSTDPLTLIADIFEYDMIPHVRISIDLEVKCGVWYDFSCEPSKKPTFTARPDIEVQYEQIVLAYDIETTKMPLKFPDSNIDQVMMISYMIDGQGFLITNREIVESNVEDFEYTPKEEFEGKFTVFNEANEKAVLLKFFSHIIQVKPMIIVTYNGDFLLALCRN